MFGNAEPTFPDFFVGNFYCSMMTNPLALYGAKDGQWAKWLAENPKFDAYGKRFAALPAIKEYLEKRNKCMM